MKAQEYIFNTGTVEQILNDIKNNLNDLKLNHKDILRVRLTIEENMLRILESGKSPSKILLSSGKKFGRAAIILQYNGDTFTFNPAISDSHIPVLALSREN